MFQKILTLIKQGFTYPYKFIQGRIQNKDENILDLQNNSGKIIAEDDKKIAVYKNEDGETTKLDPVCPHLGCLVEWNSNESIWECPCHLSKFKPTGELIEGPANKPLKHI